MLISDKQLEANRANAQKSTGPTSPEGRSIVCRNAIKNGLRTRFSVCPELGEDPEDYCLLWDEYVADWQPQGRTETSYMETMTAAQWTLARIARLERITYASTKIGQEMFAGLDRLFKYREQMERSHRRAAEDLRKAQAERRAREPEQPKPVAAAATAKSAAPPPVYVMPGPTETHTMTAASDTR